jgi:hypothetical protein
MPYFTGAIGSRERGLKCQWNSCGKGLPWARWIPGAPTILLLGGGICMLDNHETG